MKRRRLISQLVVALALLTLALAPAVGSAKVIDRIVARVNDEIITKYEVEQATTPFLLQRGMSPKVLQNPERREEIFERVLKELVDRKLILAEADKIDLSVSDEQVDRWLAMARKRQQMSEQQFKQLIKKYGMTYQEYRETVRRNLLKQRLVKVKLGRQISVSDAEVNERYRAEYGADGNTETYVSLRHILFQPGSDSEKAVGEARTEAKKVLERLEGGADFKELAQKHSDGPSANKGGLLGTFSKGELNPTLQEVAFQLEEGQHSGVVRSKFGFHIVRVDEISQRSSANQAKRKQMIRRKIQQEKLQKQLDRYVEKLRRQAFVDINM